MALERLPDETDEQYKARVEAEARSKKLGAVAAGLKGLGDVGKGLSGGPTGAMAPTAAGVGKGNFTPFDPEFRARKSGAGLAGRAYKSGGSVKKNRDGKAIRGKTRGRFV